ncbi:ComF family protein [Burkholderia alba]|uniref:ComF family protein n=1 Tax=Burkholderia alba TaxID=2683677 RepID=UPI002B055B01|nr:ComF family protein [Burkholderia alba]
MKYPAILQRSIRAPLMCAAETLARVSARMLPNQCALCGNLSHPTICAHCDAAYWNEARLRCAQCALPLPAGRSRRTGGYRCGACRDAPPPFDATLALADYRAPLDGLALDLKFRARLALGPEFAARLARLADDRLGAAHGLDLIAPVPLARRRLAERGYNQAWAIARPLARRLRVRAAATLAERVADTAPQSRLDAGARRANVAAAFALTRPVAGLHVGLVDDVMTSGATLDALAHKLKEAGARRVTNFVALRTPQD